MKKLMNVFKEFKWSAMGLMLFLFFLASCSKDDPEIVSTPAAGLVAYNLAPDKAAVGFTLSGNPFGSGFINYNGYTGNYLPIYLGNREVRSYDYTTGTTIAISNNTFADSSYYSLFLVGANGAYKNVVVEDDYENVVPVTGKAWVRYINAIADSTAMPAVIIGTISENATYATVSDFMQVDAGSVNTSVSNGGDIDASRTITMNENKIYTVLLTGMPNAADTTLGVKIRFIENGTATQ